VACPAVVIVVAAASKCCTDNTKAIYLECQAQSGNTNKTDNTSKGIAIPPPSPPHPLPTLCLPHWLPQQRLPTTNIKTLNSELQIYY